MIIEKSKTKKMKVVDVLKLNVEKIKKNPKHLIVI